MNAVPAHLHWNHGFENPALESQQTFRAVFKAMEHPGQLITIRQNPIAPHELNPATAAACLTLLDHETSVWTDIDWKSPAISWLLFGCNSSVVTEACMADFVLVTGPDCIPDLSYLRITRRDDPEKAITLMVQVGDIQPNSGCGPSSNPPGNSPGLLPKGIPDRFWYQWRQLSALYPCSIDVFFTCEDVLTALPKTKPYEN